jgi:hypothetical protein
MEEQRTVDAKVADSSSVAGAILTTTWRGSKVASIYPFPNNWPTCARSCCYKKEWVTALFLCLNDQF